MELHKLPYLFFNDSLNDWKKEIIAYVESLQLFRLDISGFQWISICSNR
jgi:hypothetical protein